MGKEVKKSNSVIFVLDYDVHPEHNYGDKDNYNGMVEMVKL